jgi:16S rRNA (cytidine1402-2'-O)-methyltransferase
MRPKLLAAIAEGKSVAYASEAGTPLVADPGYQLAKEAQEAGHLVTSAPGPSAVIAALSVAGLPTDRFMFAGFAPAAKVARSTWLAELNAIPATLVIYESPKRVHRILDDMLNIYGGDRQIAICRELTKKFEEVLRGSLSEVMAVAAERSFKGEIVLVVDRDRREAQGETMEEALMKAMETMSVKDAAAMVASALGLHKRLVYQAALEMMKK